VAALFRAAESAAVSATITGAASASSETVTGLFNE
jgi:hypothetical protein